MSELQKIDTVLGDGKEATAGNHVDVHYTGWLFDEKAPDHKGQKFDSSLDRGQLFSFLWALAMSLKAGIKAYKA